MNIPSKILSKVNDLSPLNVAIHLETVCQNPVEVTDSRGRSWMTRCMNREAARCPSCSRVTTQDWAAIMRSGVFNAPPSASSSRWMFLTLTAPSFGPVHYVPRDHQRTRRCACAATHNSRRDDHLRGSAVHPNTYRYDDQVRWNRDSGRLFDRTRAALMARIPDLSYAAVREWQSRGTIHLHVILRIPNTIIVSTGEVMNICRLTSTVSPIDDNHARWGNQIDCRVTDPGSQARTIGYMAKTIGYSIKDVAGGLGLASTDHSRALDSAASRMDCGGGSGYKCKLSECKHRSHRRYGSRGKIVHVGRKWSYTGLTRAKQRKERADWVAGLTAAERAAWSEKSTESAQLSLALQRARRQELRGHRRLKPKVKLALGHEIVLVDPATGEIVAGQRQSRRLV